MAAFREQSRNARFLVIVPTLALLDQWYVSLVEDLGVPKGEIACFSGEERAAHPETVNLLVINTARSLGLKVARDADNFLLVDECHRAGSEKNALALRGKYGATLGLSATPEREYDTGLQKHIEPVLGPIIYTYDYKQAHADGVITPFDLVNVKIDLLRDEKQTFEKLTKSIAMARRQEGEEEAVSFRVKSLLRKRAMVAGSAAMRLPIAVKLVEQHRGQRAIVFHERVDAANAIADMLKNRNHSVTSYHSKIGSILRRDNLRLYRRGLFDVIVCCRALDEGLNVPATSVGIIASSTASQRQRIQRLGRVLRPARRKNHATIYTVYATEQEGERLQREAARLHGVGSIVWNIAVR